MGREIRRVPADWQHPRYFGAYQDGRPRYVPLHDGLTKDIADWDEGSAKWSEGLRKDYSAEFDGSGWKPRESDDGESFVEWTGERPKAEEYMPDWPAEQRTHLMMYETCSEGTPISPAFETPEELAHWLADNNASAFGSATATYEQWLATCRSGWAPSGIFTPATGMISGVEGLTLKETKPTT